MALAALDGPTAARSVRVIATSWIARAHLQTEG